MAARTNLECAARRDESLGNWYFLAAFFVLVMVAVGGLTRLTGSGLSMVEWNLVWGILPPLTEQDWLSFFEAYRSSPEFQKINFGLDLKAFKGIFWLEYIHRFLARLIFVWILGSAIYIVWKKPLSQKEKNYLFLVPILFVSQGILGWLMVKSGLKDNPHVSPFFLSFHLILAFGLFSYTIHRALRLNATKMSSFQPAPRSWVRWAYLLYVLLAITLFWGGLVAGNKAGLLYPTFPKMGGFWIVSELKEQSLLSGHIFMSPGALYAIHRLLAFSLLILGITGCLYGILRLETERAKYFWWCMSFLLLQLYLGAHTALSHVAIQFAALHQVNAFLLCGSLLILLKNLGGNEDLRDQAAPTP